MKTCSSFPSSHCIWGCILGCVGFFSLFYTPLFRRSAIVVKGILQPFVSLLPVCVGVDNPFRVLVRLKSGFDSFYMVCVCVCVCQRMGT